MLRLRVASLLWLNGSLRKLLSISLLLAVLLPFLAPALAWAQGSDSQLPACCRRSGAHHCNGGMTAAFADGHHHATAPGAHCPFGPQGLPGAHAKHVAFAARYITAAFARATNPTAAPLPPHRQTERDRTRSQRGPPRA